MNRKDIDRLLVEAKRITNHPGFVIIGSLSVLGAVANPPVSMTGSIDIDLYPKNDPGRASEIAKILGLGSESRDREWIRAGLEANILSLPTIEYRLRETIMETDERQRAKQSIEEDRAWLTANPPGQELN
ncbi:MAG: hypothetical protein HZA59_00075 [Hydrogenophilales bacterium]|nr:hypothetical protein [Hydrogenophilales bacterium]